MVIPNGGHVSFIVLLRIRDSIRSSIPWPDPEALRERGEGAGRERAQQVGHGDPRATDDSITGVGSLVTVRARAQERNALAAWSRAGRIGHRA